MTTTIATQELLKEMVKEVIEEIGVVMTITNEKRIDEIIEDYTTLIDKK